MRSKQGKKFGLLRAFRADLRGAIAVEHAFAAPVLLIILSGAIDLGLALHESSTLSNAARAGAQYAMRFPSDADGIKQVVQKAVTYDPSTLTVNTTLTCECSGGTVVLCTDTCGSSPPKSYVSVNVSKPYSSPLPTAMIIGVTTVSGSAIMRAN